MIVATLAAGTALAVLVGRDGSPAGQAVRVAVVAGITAMAIVAQARVPGRPVGAGSAALGGAAMAAGSGFVPHLVKQGLSSTAVAALVAVTAGMVLLVSGTAIALRHTRIASRIAGGTGAVVGTALTLWVVTPVVVATNVPRPDVGATPAAVGLEYDDVTLATHDGVRLAAWYIPSSGGAAVVLRHGAGSTRSDVLDEAAVLARRGFGVLLVDARGHGDSGGRAMDFGWSGDADIGAATRFLSERDDVDPDGIGVVGMSMGGEEAIGAAAADPRIRAVVAEGATGRTAADKAWLSERYGIRGLAQEQLEKLQYGLTDLLTSASPPAALRHAVARSSGTRFLLVTAGDRPDEAYAAAYIAGGDPSRAEIWTVPGAGHTGGLETRPEEWERRVITFLDTQLG